MDVMVTGLGLPLVVDAFGEAGVDLSEDVLDCALDGVVVGEVERGGVDEGECEHLRVAVTTTGSVISGVEVDVDVDGADVGGVSAASLDELCDGDKLILCGCCGDVAGVEEETEEGRLSGALAGDHQGVSSVGMRCSGAQAVGGGGRGMGRGVVGEHSGDGGEGRRASAMVVAGDGERHDSPGEEERRGEKGW